MRDMPTVAVSAQDHKLAALLFDYVVPVHSSSAVPEEVKLQHTALDAFGKGDADSEIIELTEAAEQEAQVKSEAWLEGVVAAMPSGQVNALRDTGLSDQRIAALEIAVNRLRNRYTAAIRQLLTKSGVRAVPVFRSSSTYDMYFGCGGREAVEVTLLNAPLIDTTDLEWSDILEIRRNEGFTRQLRDFRLFINRNYKGKEAAEVLDDLNQRLDNYERSCNANGLKLVLGTLRQMLDSRCLLSALGVAVLGIVTGYSWEGLLAGTAIEVGKVAISVAERKISLRESVKWGELAYLAIITSAVEK